MMMPMEILIVIGVIVLLVVIIGIYLWRRTTPS